ncbi:MAG: rod-binding protein [Phycisphaerae bacterium]
MSFPIQPMLPTPGQTDLLRTPQKADSSEQAAKDFESVLLHKLLETMDRTVIRSELFDSPASEQVRGMFRHFLAQELSRAGGIGLWKQLHSQLQNSADVGEQGQSASLEQEL